jgi:flagellar hook-associated protein 3 FlgL
MAINSNMRLGSANAYDAAVNQLNARQSALSALQENLTSGKKVVRASDDPVGAAQAERALTRISRIQTDQRALGVQKNAITVAEATLGDAVNALQSFRELTVSAGNGTLSTAERQSIAQQLSGYRDQIFALANTKDTNGQPLFGALGSALAPFVQNPSTTPDYTFNGVAGQQAATEVSIPAALDGDKAFMFKPTEDGSYDVKYATNVGQSSTSAVTPLPPTTPPTIPTPVPGTAYQIEFSGAPGAVQYTVTPAPASGSSSGAYVSGQPITFDGLSVTVSGTPQNLDTFDIKASSSLFSVLDQAIANIGGASTNADCQQAVVQGLANIDIGLNRLQAARGLAGDLLNRADRISTGQESRSVQLEADRSRAEDLDMVKGIADFQKQQTGYSAALQSYAQIQKLSLFNYIS